MVGFVCLFQNVALRLFLLQVYTVFFFFFFLRKVDVSLLLSGLFRLRYRGMLISKKRVQEPQSVLGARCLLTTDESTAHQYGETGQKS